jgi:hypothetical protein
MVVLFFKINIQSLEYKYIYLFYYFMYQKNYEPINIYMDLKFTAKGANISVL